MSAVNIPAERAHLLRVWAASLFDRWMTDLMLWWLDSWRSSAITDR